MAAKKILSNIDYLRFKRDEELLSEILSQKATQQALAKLEHWSSGYGFSHRRHLLSQTVRLNKSLCPDIFKTFEECRSLLEMHEPIELYVASYLGINAYAAEPNVGPKTIVLGSQLIKELTADELKFVIGHELGHLKFEHTKYPLTSAAQVHDSAGRLMPLETLLKVYTWSRTAEVSADRAGLYCVKNLNTAISCIFKLASGLELQLTENQINDFVQQLEEMVTAPMAQVDSVDKNKHSECFQTHPFNPLRIRALSLTARSGLIEVNHPITPLNGDRVSLDECLDEDLKIMEPDYLQKTDNASQDLKDLLLYAGLLLAHVDGQVSESEIKAIKSLVGASKVNVDTENIEYMKAKVEYLGEKCSTSCHMVSRHKLLQHLVLISSVDGEIQEKEISYIYSIASKLKADSKVIDSAINIISRLLD
jgi:Zn-dependent protease with chaperone function/uncharacterized tellurite resistance protein B-like protein